MAENRYRQKSRLRLNVRLSEGRPVLSGVSFTAPFKAISPFYDDKGRITVMLISVSAGLMAGDTQEIEINAGPGTRCVVTSQAFEKIHKMEEGGFATRLTRLSVGSGAEMVYSPLPAIPFEGSAFRGETAVELADDSARLCFGEILACGRASRGERFMYREHRSLTRVYAGGNLIYSDNAAFVPSKADLAGFCGFEGYSHMGSLFLANYRISDEQYEQVREAVYALKGGVGGVTRTGRGDVCVRGLAEGSEPLIDLNGGVKRILGI